MLCHQKIKSRGTNSTLPSRLVAHQVLQPWIVVVEYRGELETQDFPVDELENLLHLQLEHAQHCVEEEGRMKKTINSKLKRKGKQCYWTKKPLTMPPKLACKMEELAEAFI